MSVACFLTPLGVALAAVWAAVTSATLIYAIAGRDGVLIAASVVAIVVTVAAGARFAVTVNAEPALDEDRTYVISGRVTERHVYSDGEFKATLDDLTVNDTPLGGRISLTISEAGEEYGYVDCGYVIETEGRARYRDIVRSDGIDASGVRSGVTYNVYADAEDVREVTPGDAGFLESMRAALHDTLTSRMGADAGEIAYGMIAGDQYALDEEVREDYSRAGIGHVLSVSGLHIALISAALCKLLFAVGLPRHPVGIVSTAVLVLYVLFTGGSPSAVRSFVMCAVVMWSYLLGRADTLNSLGLGGTICLCLSPFFLFETGFVLSVSAVFGLIVFTRPMSKAFARVLPKPVSDALSASLGAQLAITPALAIYFSRAYLYSFAVNALMMGVLSAFFTLLVAVLPFALIPALGGLLVPLGFGIDVITSVCSFVADLPLAEAVWIVSPAVMLVLPLMFFISRFFRPPHKRVVNCFLVAACAAVCVLSTTPVRAENALLAAGGESAVTVVWLSGEQYVAGDFEGGDVVSTLDEAGVAGECVALVERMSHAAAENILELNELRPVGRVVFAAAGGYDGVSTLIASGLDVVAAEMHYGPFAVALSEGEARGWLLDGDGTTVYITSGDADATIAGSADVVRSRTAYARAEGALYVTARDHGSPSVLALPWGDELTLAL